MDDMPLFDLPVMQWIASTALTVASTIVAIVAATFSYRQNYGWKPVVLVLAHGFDNNAWIDFELWNRRKYPVVVHGVEIKFGNLSLDHSGKTDPWYIFHNKLCHREQVRLDPASHHLFQPRVPFEKQTLGKSETVRIDVFYFDPIRNRRKKVAREHQYKYTEEC
jgi:hypothetical protein